MMLLIFGSKMFGIIKIISIMILILTITHLAPAGQPAPGITPSEAALLPLPPPSVEQNEIDLLLEEQYEIPWI